MDNTQQALKAAVLGAQEQQAPQSNPLGASHAADQANYMSGLYQYARSKDAAGASGFNTSAMVDNQAKQAAIAAKKAADVADASKYRSVPKQDGGFDFFDPEGNQVDIATLTNRTNTKASDWIKDSTNPIDTQYLEDTKNLNGLIQAVQSKDTSALNKYKKGFADNGLPDLTQSKVEDILNQYHQYYKRYYLTRQEDPSAWGTRPNENPLVPAPQTLGATDQVGI